MLFQKQRKIVFSFFLLFLCWFWNQKSLRLFCSAASLSLPFSLSATFFCAVLSFVSLSAFFRLSLHLADCLLDFYVIHVLWPWPAFDHLFLVNKNGLMGTEIWNWNAFRNFSSNSFPSCLIPFLEEYSGIMEYHVDSLIIWVKFSKMENYAILSSIMYIIFYI